MPLLTEALRQRLIAAALDTQKNAYVPYSHYPVGAALLAAEGQVYTGCNVENAAYPATICAERTAVVKAVSEGVRQFEAIVVITQNGVLPCGTCRQVLNEFAPSLIVIAADTDGVIHHEMLLTDLLPNSFGPRELSEGTSPGGAVSTLGSPSELGQTAPTHGTS